MFYLSKNLNSLMQRVSLTGESNETNVKHRIRDPLNAVIFRVVSMKNLTNKYCNIKIFNILTCHVKNAQRLLGVQFICSS